AGLNAIITGFPRNHHGYMCGYSPGTARRGNFGLPRIIKIIKDEVPWGLTRAPIQKGELEALAMAVKAAGEDNVYPTRIGYTFVGDAHWACLPHTPLYRRVKIQKTVNDIKRMAMEGLLGDKVAILGARFLSWVIGKELEDCVDEIIISDTDQWVESVTLDNLRSHLKVDLDGVNGDDKKAYEYADTTIISSTIPTVVNRISRDFRDTISFI
ncbi:MAG: 5,10-methenyltetrahydromethanopterin hydrogenase cofactor biosynthesis protein HmdC, partial [Methanobacteriaceae archaeon]|nr:5,10-methenyltetrahydromethanopterin hydrogenase cofactor biosynthesis protein HmdC [Methanobacteriaceae archaeon]